MTKQSDITKCARALARALYDRQQLFQPAHLTIMERAEMEVCNSRFRSMIYAASRDPEDGVADALSVMQEAREEYGDDDDEDTQTLIGGNS